MKHRIWSMQREHFDLLIKHLALTKVMKEALVCRYENEWKTRSAVAGKFKLSVHGIMKAEKQMLEAHKDFMEHYANRSW